MMWHSALLRVWFFIVCGGGASQKIITIQNGIVFIFNRRIVVAVTAMVSTDFVINKDD